MGAEEMHIIRAQRTENGLGEPDQWLHLLQLKKRRAWVFSNLGLHNIILTNTMGLPQSGVFQRLYLEYFTSVISV